MFIKIDDEFILMMITIIKMQALIPINLGRLHETYVSSRSYQDAKAN